VENCGPNREKPKPEPCPDRETGIVFWLGTARSREIT